MKETLKKLFATLTPANTELALQLAIGQGFSDEEIAEMRPICFWYGKETYCKKWATDIEVSGDASDAPVCRWCLLPF